MNYKLNAAKTSTHSLYAKRRINGMYNCDTKPECNHIYVFILCTSHKCVLISRICYLFPFINTLFLIIKVVFDGYRLVSNC